MTDESTISHPIGTAVKVLGGSKTVHVRKWKMRDRAVLKPRIAAIFEKFKSASGEDVGFGLAPLMLLAEDEVYEICKATTELEGEFDDLDYDDLLDIAQAVWTTNIAQPEGGGLLGKAATLLAPLMVSNSSSPMSESEPNGQDSVSSPDPGDQHQSD